MIAIFRAGNRYALSLFAYYRFMSVLAFSLFCGMVVGQDYDLSDEQVEVMFDRAMRQADGKEFRQVMHPDEVKGVSEAVCTKFLTIFVGPWYKGPSIQMKGGVRVPWSSGACDLEIQFRPEGGITYMAVNNREFVFRTPVVQVGGGAKSSVGFADILFGIAAERTIEEKTRLAKMKQAQKLVEGYIATAKKMGIKGSIDSDLGKWVTWDVVIAESRAEVKKAEGGG